MQLDKFFNLYAEEEKCKQFFKEQRQSQGIKCKKCDSSLHFWIESQSKWQCKKCKYRTGLKCGTVMENSNLGYRVWLWALYLMSATKKGFSALEMQRLIGHSRYEPIWLLMHKIRVSMGSRDNKYKLEGFTEMDEGFFEGHRKKEDEQAEGEQVKELDRQVKAVVAVSTTPIPIEKQQKNRPATYPGYVKMSVVSSLNKIEVTYDAAQMVQKSATVITDGRRCYTGLQEICKVHKEVIVKDKKEVSKTFPWVHIAISNMKKKVIGLHHHVKNEYMQNYLNEFCYKFNRRKPGIKLFERLMEAALASAGYKPMLNSG
jgi:ribosomal protein L37AE/L43A